jgi:hypothetical protein
MESKYKSLSEWRKADRKAYEIAKKNNLIDDICENFGWEIKKPNGYWTKENVVAEALKYKTIKEWIFFSGSSYSASKRNGWSNECTIHMSENRKPHGYWSKKLCIDEALKYNIRTQWQKNNPTSYQVARKNGWMDECCGHMKYKKYNYGK